MNFYTAIIHILPNVKEPTTIAWQTHAIDVVEVQDQVINYLKTLQQWNFHFEKPVEHYRDEVVLVRRCENVWQFSILDDNDFFVNVYAVKTATDTSESQSSSNFLISEASLCA